MEEKQEYKDGIVVSLLSEEYHEQAKEVFTEIWLQYNVIYNAAKINEAVFGEYVDVLLQRAKADKKTAAIALDTTVHPFLVVSVGFAKDLYNDPVADLLENLPQSMRPLLQFNKEAIEHFTDNPAFQSFQKPGKVVYFLHAGTRDAYVGRFCDGMTISTRLGAFMMKQWIMEGHEGYLGVATNPEMVRRGELEVQQNKNTICITKKPFSSWLYNEIPFFPNLEGCAYVTFSCLKNQSKL